MQISLFIRLGLAVVAGVLAWAAGPGGLLDKDVVSEIPAWILPGVVFGGLVLVHFWTSPSRALAAVGIGVLTWITGFATVCFGVWIVGWLATVLAGLTSGAMLGVCLPRLMKSSQRFRYFMAFSIASVVGSIPFAIYFSTIFDFKGSLFPPQWAIPSYIFWNVVIATTLHFCDKGDTKRSARSDSR